MNTLFDYDSRPSDAGRSLILETEGAGMAPSRTVDRHGDVLHLNDDGTRYTAAEVMERDGVWKELMRTTYRRGE